MLLFIFISGILLISPSNCSFKIIGLSSELFPAFPKEFLNYYLERKITFFINFKSKLETHFRNDYLNKALKELENLYKNIEELSNVISKIDSWQDLILRYKILKKKI